MKLRGFVFMCVCLLVSANALAGRTTTQDYSIDGIRHIVASHAVKVEIRQSESESLTAEANEDVMERLLVKIDGDRLTLGVKHERGLFNWFGGHDGEVTFTVQLADLSRLDLSGASHAVVGDLQGESLTLDISGASQARFDSLRFDSLDWELSGASRANVAEVITSEIQVSLSGASKLELRGTKPVDQLDLELSGASKYDGDDLEANRVRVNASGASQAKLKVNETLDANASGASGIRYSGSPQVKQKTSGASHINSSGN